MRPFPSPLDSTMGKVEAQYEEKYGGIRYNKAQPVPTVNTGVQAGECPITKRLKVGASYILFPTRLVSIALRDLKPIGEVRLSKSAWTTL